MNRLAMSSPVRKDLKLIFESSVNAVKPDSLIKSFIQINENQLLVKTSQNVEKKFSLNRDVFILGAGKAVLKMCEEFLNQLDSYNNELTNNSQKLTINAGALSVPIGSQTTRSSLFAKYNVHYRTGALNNMPDMDSQKNTIEIVDLVKSAKSCLKNRKTSGTNPLIISFISGGGSALLSLPKPGLTLNEKCSLISQLVKSGANINELNFVRRCLSQVKGGKLAQMAINGPDSVEMISFIISDIIEDPIELIASGPTVVHRTDSEKPSDKALKILNHFNIEVKDNLKSIILLEDKESDFYDRNGDNLLHNIIIGNNSIALNVAQNTAKELGYKVVFLGNTIKGEARDVANEWLRIALNYKYSEEDVKNFRGICWIGGGETTVNMTDSKTGLGGRCQEMGLAFYRAVYDMQTDGKFYFLCAGSDGQDGPTDAAGVIVENITKDCDPNQQILKQSDIDLRNHNSHHFFKTYYNEWFVKTGITGTNVMDIYCLVKTFS